MRDVQGQDVSPETIYMMSLYTVCDQDLVNSCGFAFIEADSGSHCAGNRQALDIDALGGRGLHLVQRGDERLDVINELVLVE